MKDIILVFLAIIFAIFIFWYLYRIDFVNIKEGVDTRTNNALITAGKKTQKPTVEQMAYIESILNHTALNSSTKVEKLRGAPGIDLIPHVLKEIINNTTQTEGFTEGYTYRKEYAPGQDGDAEKISDIKDAMKITNLDSSYEDLVLYYPLCSLDQGGNVLNQSHETNLYGEPLWEGDHAYDGVIYGGKLDHNEFRGSGNASIRFTPKDENCTSSQGGTFIKINKLPTFYKDGKFTGFSIALWSRIDKEQKSPRKNQWYSRFFDFGVSTEGGQKEFAYFNNNIVGIYADWNNNVCFANAVGTYNQPASCNGIASTDVPTRDEIWRHFVFTMDDTGLIKMYVDGNLVKGNYISDDKLFNDQTEKNKNTYAWGSSPVIPKNVERDLSYIGRSNWPWDSYYSGHMADFRIYTKAISQDIILNILNIQRKTIDSGALLNGGGTFGFGGGAGGQHIRLNFILNERDNKTVSTDENNNLIWKNQYNPSMNNAIGSNNSLTYCTRTGKITVPHGQYMTINPSDQSNFAPPFTMFIVADVKSFDYKYLIGSNTWNGFEVIFNIGNNDIYVSAAGTGGSGFRFNSGASLNPAQVDGNGINIFTITCDQNGSYKFYLNSKKFGDNRIGTVANAPILLGATLLSGYPVFSSKNTDLDYYNFMHCSGVFPEDLLRIYECYFASKYKIRNKLSDNPYSGYNFTWFPF